MYNTMTTKALSARAFHVFLYLLTCPLLSCAFHQNPHISTTISTMLDHDKKWSIIAKPTTKVTYSSRPSSWTSLCSTQGDVNDSAIIWTQQDVKDFALQQGIELSFSTLGPGYRVVARAKHDPELVLGYCEGFLRPAGQILHLDKMEVFKKMVRKASAENENFKVRCGSAFGMGLLMGLFCVLHGQENNCKNAEFLAIDDEAEQHRKLVQYYKRSGFEIIKYVGDDIGDIPDRLVWGGCGTLMRQQIDVLVKSWSKTLETSRAKNHKS